MEDNKQPKPNLAFAIQTLGAKSLHNITNLGKKLLNLVKIAEFLKNGVLGFKSLLIAILLIMICVGIIALIYIIARVYRIRGFNFGHSEDITSFMKSFHGDVNTTRKLLLHANTIKSVYQTKSMNLIDRLGCNYTLKYFQSTDIKLQHTLIDTYFKYRDVLYKVGSKFYQKDMDEIKRKIVSMKSADYHRFLGIQNVDRMTGEEYIDKAIIKPFDKVREELRYSIQDTSKVPQIQKALFLCSSLTQKEYDSREIPRHSNPQAIAIANDFVEACKQKNISYDNYKGLVSQLVDLCIGINLLYIYTNVYYDTIKSIHNHRRFGFFNLLMMLLVPYYETLINENVVKKWKTLFNKKGLERDYKEFQKSWKKIGVMLKNLPKRLATEEIQDEPKTQKPKKQRKTRKERFTELDYEEEFDEEGEDDEDVIEGFGFIKGLLSIGDFFLAILNVAKGLAKLVSRPLEMITYLIKMIFGLFIGLILIIIYLLFSIPPLIYIIYGIYFFIFNIVMMSIFSMFWIGLFALFSILGCIIWTVDLMLSSITGFKSHSFLVWFVRCENLPDIWYTRANFVDGNRYARGFLCQSPCSSRFLPNGMYCKRMDEQKPSYCPQAQVYRIYRGLSLKPEPMDMGEFKPSVNFYIKSKADKEEELREFFQKRQAYLTKCSRANEPYENLIKGICGNFDTVKIKDKNLRKELATLCNQIYCQGEPKEEFCYKFKSKIDDLKIAQKKLSQEDIIKRVLNLSVLIIVAIIIILMFLHNS
jgi:hypothetical protein